MDLIEKLIRDQELEKEEYVKLFEDFRNLEAAERLSREAVRIRKENYGDKIYTRGLIEFTNYCKNNCYYCGIRRGNKHASRYRLTPGEIMECCQEGYRLGFRTFVLQGGEDPYFNDQRMAEIVSGIKETYPDCAVTLSIGEKSKESYRLLKEAGADRYLLRHETANEEHYRFLHPEEMSLKARKQCLYDLREIGFQVGAGFMVGSPGQRMEHLAEDFLFLKELNPHMVGIGPFIPHHDTRYREEPGGSVELTVFLLSVLRIVLPKALLPATTALGTLDPYGREKGFCAGANVVMPNLSPLSVRKKYELYDNKINAGDDGEKCLENLRERAKSVGYRLVCERGDSLV